ncbi:uncharacterized protein LOC135834240 [Planococcus citri]|uniref:uncharacterized protein LOC135834240 n=1 Tax=Planococcus citri TaxID=170843 RepID=UPI0031F8038E
MSLKRKRGQVIHSEARTMIANIINMCEEEKRLKAPLADFDNPLKRAASYCNASLRTINRVKKEYNAAAEQNLPLPAKCTKLSSPGKKRNKESFSKCDEFDQQVIRRTISNFYLEDKPRVPSTSKLLSVMKEDTGFPYCREKLRQLLHNMGYSWKKCGTRRKILVERAENIAWRRRYIAQIRKYRSENKKIYYIDETRIDNDSTYKKSCQGEGLADAGVIVENNSSKNRLILVHACSAEDGLLEGAKLLYRENVKTGDYHGQMNADMFFKWITTKLIPSLPSNSVVVMDNAAYHNALLEKVPNKYSLKAVMKEWLRSRDIPFDENMLRHELYALIEQNKPKEKKYVIDEIMRKAGHIVLRLPPYMCELNIIEMVWCRIKTKVREMNITGGDSCQQKLFDAVENAILSVTPRHTKNFLDPVIELENDYWENDPKIEDKIDEVIVNLAQCSSDEDEDDDSCEESECDDELDNFHDKKLMQ